jgi:magnesium transporter
MASTHAVDPSSTRVIDLARKDFTRISVDHTVGQALAELQNNRVGERIVYFYVVDADDRLRGVVPTRGLLLNRPETPVAAIMVRKLVTLPAQATLLDACEMFILHRLLALPVVDDAGRILGVVDVGHYTDEIMHMTDREVSNDVFQLIGVRLAQVHRASVPVVFRRRFPWLLCNVLGGVACAAIVGLFEKVLAQAIVLALFIPIVMALAESVSMQSLALTLQAQHGGRIAWQMVLRSLAREIPVGLLLGAACGGLVALVAWIARAGALVALCMWLSIVLAVTTSAALGMLVPAVLGSARRDLKIASGPIALALGDMATLVYYFGLAALLLGR